MNRRTAHQKKASALNEAYYAAHREERKSYSRSRYYRLNGVSAERQSILEARRLARKETHMEIIDSGTITQETTDDFSSGSSGPSGPTLDGGTITPASTNDASAVGPCPARWPTESL
jgi:hypothetical protein